MAYHITDKGQVMGRYYGLYANAHRGIVRKTSTLALARWMVEEDLKPVPSKGWAAKIAGGGGSGDFRLFGYCGRLPDRPHALPGRS